MKPLSDDILIFSVAILAVSMFIPELWMGVLGITTLIISIFINKRNERNN